MKFAPLTLSLCLLASSTVALAEDHMHSMQHGGDMHTMSQGHMGHGVVNKIDLQHNKVNMTHGPIQSLAWPGMTMDFKVKDAAILKGLKPGQQVTFEVVNEGPRQYFVTRITPQK